MAIPNAIASSNKNAVVPICRGPAQTWQPLQLWPKAKVEPDQPVAAGGRTASRGTLKWLIAGHPRLIAGHPQHITAHMGQKLKPTGTVVSGVL